MSDDAASRDQQRVVRLLTQMQAKLDAAERRAHAPIAVIGIGCRMPGGAGDAQSFWRLLESGADAVVEVPRTRWDIDAWYDPDPDAPGKMNTRRGGFLDGVDLFDAEFFGIAPREAVSMDPQQRLILEVAWRALEHAGRAPTALAGTPTGVYLGVCTSDYARLGDGSGSLGALDTYSGTGGANGVAAGRLSYTLGLTGPSFVVDTACSSSLVAAHLAVQGLRAHECDLALAGGVNLVLIPDGTVALSRLHMMAPDGRCKAFDAAADGFVRGEGCGIVVLKRLDDALADGDRVLAVIRGSAVNQDGRSAGLTAPSGLAQQAVVRAALADAGVAPADIGYVEAHGTGTALGDPVELNALATVLGPGRTRALRVGAVKTNLGHLEAAAGIAGLIKTVETVRRGRIAPTLHFQSLNPHVRTGDCAVEIPTVATDWPADAPRIAGVSAFGFSGTNAHLVLEAPPTEGDRTPVAPRAAEVLPLSARNAAALGELKDAVLAAPQLEAYADACFTAGTGRGTFAHRLAIVAGNADEAREKLRAASGRPAGKPRIAFVFSGQGAQWSGMGRALHATEPAFRAALERCAAVLDPLLGRPLLPLLFEGGTELDRTGFAQPALLAFELALAEMLRDWGIEPEALLGHSLGEYAAAAVAGALTEEEALRLVVARGQAMQALPAGGAMAAVLAGRAAVEPLLAADARLALAADNGPSMVTLSGPEAAIEAACAALEARGIGTRRLAVSHAFHSALMEPALAAIEAAAGAVAWRPPRIPVIGNVAAEPVAQFDAAYWRRHTRAPVAFAAGVRRLAALGCDTFVEIGPNPVLLNAGRACTGSGEWLAAARRGHDAATIELLARLFTAGVDVDWTRVHAGRGRRVVDFPGHPMQRRSFWRGAGSATVAAAHPWLARRTDLPDGRSAFHATLPDAATAFLASHRAHGTPIAPAAALLEAAASAASRCGHAPALAAVAFEAALPLDAAREVTIEVAAQTVAIHSRPAAGGDWTCHLRADLGGEAPPPRPVGEGEAAQAIAPDALYAWMRDGGVEHGETFRRIATAARGEGVARASLAPLARGPYLVHPALLDAAFQALAVASFAAGDGRMRLPVTLDRFVLAEPRDTNGAIAHAHLELGGSEAVADVWLADGTGRTLAIASGLRLQGAPAATRWHEALLERTWREKALPPTLAELTSAVRGVTDADAVQASLAGFAGLGASLDRLAAAYAARALEAVAPDKVAPRHRALYARLPKLAAGAPEDDPDALAHALRQRHPGCERELDLLVRCGRRLAAVVTGEQDPLQLLFPGGDDGSVYRDSPVSRMLNQCVEAAVLAALPAAGPVRILEAGAGTGGTTEGLLARLPHERLAEYAFTDIAPSLLAAAAKRHAAVAGFRTARLDIDADPEAQGFAAGPYDIVLAANVVHAGVDLVASLARLRRLLAPHGTLVLLEGADAQGWIDLVFGLTEGWWRFADRARRPDYPLPDRAGWLDALRAAGFDAAAADLRAGDVLERQVVLVARPAAATRWFVAGGDDAVSQALAARLGAPCITPDAAWPAGEWDGCVYTGALAIAAADDASAMMEAQRKLLEPERRLALACSERGLKLAVVTAGALAARPEQATAWGLGRAIAAELPDLALKLVEIDPALPAATAAERLGEELLHPDGEDQVRLDADARRVARLVPCAVATAEVAPARLDAEAAYLVTGGFGGLGLHAARWLAARGARTLVLLGRSPPSEGAQRDIAALESAGVAVTVKIGDVGRESDLREAIAAAAPRRLAGVVHAAGTLDDGVLAQLDWPRIERVLHAKVAGAWLIDRLCGRLDFLLLYSSAVGLVGTRGQANHIAANAYLDALAAARRARGEAAVSLAWGPWRAIGSATDAQWNRRQQAGGMDPVDPGMATQVLDWALAHAPAFAGVLPLRLAAFRRALAGHVPPVLRELVPPAPHEPAPALPHATRSAAIDAQQGAVPASAPAASQRLLDLVLAEAASVLAATGPEAIDPARSLFELGLDSLMAVELRNRLQAKLGRALSSTLLFDHPAPRALAAFLGDTRDEAQRIAGRDVREEPIAIVGLDCRFPGGASDPDRYWERLCAGFDAIGPLPESRAAACGRASSRPGAWLDGVDLFDAAFFHVAPREAASMDPQQRLLLETAWHALERAGQAPDALAGTATGVFVGVCNYDYPQLVSAAGQVDAWSATGGAPSIVAGRLAYTLGLEGPAMVVDTACSSSLVAVHLACRSLHAGECDLALAGGVNLILAPSATEALAALQMLAPDGRCKAFDARADGFVRGEGCGVVVLKRLSDAQAAGDRVLAVIRASWVNQDGRSPSLTAPSGRAQEAVIREAVAHAGVEPAQVGYVEAHGTGTQLGDPIEIHALRSVFGGARGEAGALAIGAVKSNLGHLEAAAGIAGLVKAALAIDRARIPPNLHFSQLNPHIALEGLEAVFPATAMAWPGSGPRIAGVSSFGFSGTNAHVVLAEPPAVPAARIAPSGPQLIAVSAATAAAARTLATALAARLESEPTLSLADLACTLLAGRAQLAWRIAVVARDARDAAAQLRNSEPVAVVPQPGPVTPVPAGGEATATALQALRARFLEGHRLGADALRAAGASAHAGLPVYPFERQRHWVEAAPAKSTATAMAVAADAHPLLGARLPGPGATRRYQGELSVARLPWLADHAVGGVATLPAAAMLETMAATQPVDEPIVLEDVAFGALLEVEEPATLHTEREATRATLFAAAPGTDAWREIASANVATAGRVAEGTETLDALRARFTQDLPVADFYAAIAGGTALGYGPAFRTITRLQPSPDHEPQALALVTLPPGLEVAGLRLHPALLDGAFQSVGAAMAGLDLPRGAWLPAGVDRFHLAPGSGARSLWAWTRVRALDDGAVAADIDLFEADGRIAGRVESLRLRPDRRAAGRRAFLHELRWRPTPAGRTLPATWHLAGGGEPARALREDLARRLAANGHAIAPVETAAAVAWFVATDATDAAAPCAELLPFAQTLARRAEPPQFWIVTRGESLPAPQDAATATPAGAAVWGFAATLRLEHPELALTLVDLPAQATDAAPLLAAFAHRGTTLAVRADGRIEEREAVALPGTRTGGRFALTRPASGKLVDLAWEATPATAPGPGEVSIAVAAAGLNFRDVMNALGAYPGDAGALGGECAGFVEAVGESVQDLRPGQRVLAIAAGSHASHAVAPASLVWPVPADWSLEQAAAVPTVFLTAAWALRGPGRIAAGQRVLVHAGSGGLGLAAIAIAQTAGAEVLATAGSEEKREFLRRRGVACVADSRSRSFADAVRAHTGGAGVDIVVNSLSGELIAAGFEVLRPGGRFLEVGKAGIWTDAEARAHRADVEYHRIALDAEILARPEAVGALWRELAAEFAAGKLALPPVTPFKFAAAQDAYRHMQQAKHVGRIALTRRFLRPDAAYLVTGGTGALGLATARWLAERGAGEIVLAARRAPGEDAAAALAALEATGTTVRVVQADVAREDEVVRLLASAGRPLAGLIHAAGILDDGVFASLMPERLRAVFAAKVDGARHLDRATRGRALDFFVLFSSAAGVLGSAGQANYAAANAALDAIAHDRHAQGLAALAIDWGAWAGAGLASRRGAPAMAPEHALAALEELLHSGPTQVLVLPQPLATREDRAEAAATRPAGAEFAARLAAAAASERRALVAGALRREAATILSLPPDALAAKRPLREYGLDSLMAVELRNALAALTGLRLPSSLLFDHPSLEALAAFLATKLGLDGDRTPRDAAAPAAPRSQEPPVEDKATAALSEQEIADALNRELQRAGY